MTCEGAGAGLDRMCVPCSPTPHSLASLTSQEVRKHITYDSLKNSNLVKEWGWGGGLVSLMFHPTT